MAKHGIQKIEEIIKLSMADLHIHSHYSDGRPSIAQILEYVQTRTELDVIAITDHDTIEGALEAKKIARTKNYRFEIIVGEEVTSREGHILGLFLKEAIPPGLAAREVLGKIKAQGGVSIASHPFEHTRFANPDMIMMDGIGADTLLKEMNRLNAIEVVNATPTLADENIQASVINKTLLGLAETGSSDAHIVEAIGHGYTLFEGKTAEDLKKAILSRQTQAMFHKWTLMALLKYAYFFIPKGLRIAVYTILHGRRNGKLVKPHLYESQKSE